MGASEKRLCALHQYRRLNCRVGVREQSMSAVACPYSDEYNNLMRTAPAASETEPEPAILRGCLLERAEDGAIVDAWLPSFG